MRGFFILIQASLTSFCFTFSLVDGLLWKSIHMKKLIPILGLAVLVTACNTSPKETEQAAAKESAQVTVNNLDTAGLAQYHQWRAQNELAEIREEMETPEVVKAAPVKKAAAKAPVAKASVARTSAPKADPVAKTPATVPASTGSGSQSSGSGESAEPAESAGTGDVAQAPAKKEGVSNAAKGAVIGGVAGGAAGAVVNKKNRALGGVVGGVVGAAVGYGVGKAKDKKEANQ
jgi:hypothetical protein